MSDDSDYSDNFLADIERGLGLPAGFIVALTKEDDWSLLIKTHALLETVITEVLLAFLQHEEVNTTVYRLRVLGQWFDGIRFYAAASSPRRSRRTWAGLR